MNISGLDSPALISCQKRKSSLSLVCVADNGSILDDWVWVRIAMEQCLVFTFQPSLLIKAYKVKTCISSLDNATQCRSSFHLS